MLSFGSRKTRFQLRINKVGKRDVEVNDRLLQGYRILLRQQNTHLKTQSKTGLLWSRSYFVCSAGGATIETLRDYIQSQSMPD
ncbi:hypothetical protein SESI111939_11285 [Serratia silvae]